MDVFKHVFNTWILSTLLMPLLQLINIGTSEDIPGLLLIFFLAGLLFSIPCFLLCLLSFSWMIRLHSTAKEKFVCWCIAAVISVLTGLSLTTFLLWGGVGPLDSLHLMWPGIAAAVLSICLRYRQFFRFFERKEDYDDTVVL